MFTLVCVGDVIEPEGAASEFETSDTTALSISLSLTRRAQNAVSGPLFDYYYRVVGASGKSLLSLEIKSGALVTVELISKPPAVTTRSGAIYHRPAEIVTREPVFALGFSESDCKVDCARKYLDEYRDFELVAFDNGVRLSISEAPPFSAVRIGESLYLELGEREDLCAIALEDATGELPRSLMASAAMRI